MHVQSPLFVFARLKMHVQMHVLSRFLPFSIVQMGAHVPARHSGKRKAAEVAIIHILS
jgi:hypothetical protein